MEQGSVIPATAILDLVPAEPLAGGSQGQLGMAQVSTTTPTHDLSRSSATRFGMVCYTAVAH